MRLTLVRHGSAQADAPTDEERALTPRGRADVRRVGRTLDRRGVRFDLILTSPLLRAVQTAEILAAAVGHRGPVEVARALVPMGAPRGVIALIGRHPRGARIALVAHEPILSALAAELLGVPRMPALEKGEALRIRTDDPSKAGQLRWRVDPKTGKVHRE